MKVPLSVALLFATAGAPCLAARHQDDDSNHRRKTEAGITASESMNDASSSTAKHTIPPRSRTQRKFLPDAASSIEGLEGRDLVFNGDLPPYPSRYEYFVRLYESNGHDFCGGSLIAPRVVLTAAHCLKKDKLDFVILNNYRLDSGHDRNVEGWIMHPCYLLSGELKCGDLGLILLERDAPDHIDPVALSAAPASDNVGRVAVVIGRGRTGADDERTHILLEGEVEVKSDDDCKHKDGSIPPGYVCTGALGDYWESFEMNDNDNNNNDSQAQQHRQCKGDSGGPLLFLGDDDGADVQMSVVSRSEREDGHCTVNRDALDTHPASFRGWIDRQLEEWGTEAIWVNE